MNSISSSIYTNLCPKQCYVNASQRRERPIASSEFGVLLQSCIDARSFDRAKNLHFRIREAGFEKNRDLLPKLVKLYSVCGRIDVARQLFDKMHKRNLDVFVWTAIICGYVSNGNPIEGVKLFVEMLAVGVRPDSYSFSALLKASADLGLILVIRQLHSMMVKCGRCSSLSVANSLIHAYGSFGDVDCATKVFDRIENRDVVSWSSMIQACSRIENHAESLSLFSAMQFEEFVRPNELTIVSLLPACGFYSSLRKGRAIHAFAIRNGFRENLIVGSALVSMYSRCGEPEIAYGVFKSLERRNIILWTSMIEGSALNGKFDLAMDLFKTMQECGLKPNYVTLVVVLSACSHGGLVDEGLKILKTMPQKFGVKPGIEHYACVVDMLGRVGRLVEAEKFIQGMSIKPSASVLGCLLGACQVHGNVEIGERLACKLFEIEPKNAAANYIILSNIYASSGRWDGVRHVRRLMSERGLSKETGCSWIEIGHEVHVFRAHD